MSDPLAASPEETGAVVWAVGDGAAYTREARALAGRIAASRPNRLLRLAFADDHRYEALRLVLRPGVAYFAFVALDGEVLDRGAIPCRQPDASRAVRMGS